MDRFDDEIDKMLRTIIEHYGYRNQLKKFNEECFEVIEAVMDLEQALDSISCSGCDFGEQDYYTKNERRHLEEEIADVMVLLNQFITYYDLDTTNIIDTIDKKINRQMIRIEDENNDK